MDEDEYPNFGDAFPTASTSAGAAAASWHPALRVDSEAPAAESEDDDFFDRYPGATPRKGKSQVEEVEKPTETDKIQRQPEDLMRRQSISVQHVIDVRREDVMPEDLQRVPSHTTSVEGPVSRHAWEGDEDEDGQDEQEDDEEAAIFNPQESAHEQEQDLEDLMPDQPSAEQDEAGDQVEERSMQQTEAGTMTTEEGLLSSADRYEHQGEVTEMEDAQEPSADAPLMEDEEPLPTPGHMSREPTFAMPSRDSTTEFDGAPAPGQQQIQSHIGRAQLDRSFTTNFFESTSEPKQPEAKQADLPDEWPSVGDDKVFGELLDNQQRPESREQDTLREVAAQESTKVGAPDLPGGSGEDTEPVDLAAAWEAALDDDDLLEETPTSLDPSKFFGGDDNDDDGFLEDELTAPAVPAQQPEQQQPRSTPTTQYRPANALPSSQQQSYGMPSPQILDPSQHGRSAGTPSTGLYDIYNQRGSMQQQFQLQQQPQQRPSMQTAQSFSDKSKGGYQSPYDLPMEIKPRRQPQPRPQPSNAPMSVPPPRTSSFGSQMAAGPPPRDPSVSSLSPPQSSHSGSGPPVAPPGVTPKSTPKMGSSGFFEDLPVTTKPRARPVGGAYTSQTQAQHGLPTPPLQAPLGLPQQLSPPVGGLEQQRRPYLPPTTSSQQLPTPASQQSGITGMFGGLGLRQPEKMALLPEQPMQQQPITGAPHVAAQGTLPAPPPAPTRYSPAPTASTAQAPPAASSRYSPAPAAVPAQAPARNRYPSAPAAVAPPGGVHPFAPRTSSPLAAYTDKPHPALPLDANKSLPAPPPSSPSKVNGMNSAALSMSPPQSSAPSRYAPSEMRDPEDPNFGVPPPQRPRTQSPDTAMKAARQQQSMPLPRPISSHGVRSSAILPSAQPAIRPKGPVLPHRRQFSRELSFAAPQDERSQDPLQRWKGHPIFKWSESGTVLSSFPKQTPFYAAGQAFPSVKCTPGAITVRDASVFIPMDDRNAKFPGPLTARSKGRKKDVLAWMAGKIEDLERRTEGAMLDFSMDADLRKRTEEKLVLWKIMRIFVEHDGVLEGNPKIEEEVRRVLLPNLAQMGQVANLQSPASATVLAEGVDKQVLFQLRQALLEGQRERAVWLAEEKKLWGHAMLIASTMGPDTWKQIIQAFVRSQVKTVGSDARSIAALYQVFAGNSEECVDELVPPSARAGFQMINKADGTLAGNPLEGLDQWRETLGLVTGNRTASDGPSLIALGKLLASYGRAEAAHTCYLFARALAKHSGADDAEAHFVLLGANHLAQDESFGNDLDSILLTEVYEYASSLSAPSTGVSYIPHLQAFKLMHAQELAAYGLKSQAQNYCDHITSAYTSTTRPSHYYHPTFTQAVADTSAFLAQTPHDGKSGFFSKPAMNKVSSGAASWFSKFVAGEDDQESNGSGPGGPGSDDVAGPFGMVSGDSPSISRSASVTDLYNPMMGGIAIPGANSSAIVAAAQSFAPSSAPGRYAPGSQGGSKYGPAQPYGGLGIPAAEPQRPSSARYAPAPSSQSLGVPRPEPVARAMSEYSGSYASSSRRGSAQDTSSQGSYEPRPILADESSTYSYSPVQSPPMHAQPAPAVQEPEDAFGGPNGIPEPLRSEEGGGDAEMGGEYEPPTGGYEPPSYGYQPYEPEPDSPQVSQPKKKPFGDDDDDGPGENRAAALKKAQADRAADEAFRKAAEADAARDKDKAGDKKGWFGGWFGKKDPNAMPGPIKAKLGEDNSFYYDENLKKWVNKKAGPEAATQAAAATPPPPRGPASRAMGPPSGPPSRASSGTGLTGTARPPTSGPAPTMAGPPSGPPSRVGTPASNPASETSAPSLFPPGLNGELSSSGPPSRPATSLSTASSIDDLLAGPPGARKGGTVKGKKKGGRYIDVMAQ